MNAGRVISKTPETPAEQPTASAPRQELRKLAVFGLAYFLAHEVAFLYPDAGKVLAAVWPAAGIGLGALLLLPRRLWPASLLTIFLTGVSANVLSGRPLLHSVGFMAANVLESLLCAEAMTRWCGEQIRFTRVKEIVALALCAVLVNACTALVGAGVASSTHLPFWDFWFTWWVADGLGLMLITPLLVTWAGFKVPRTG
ncbi:MAG: MASE1 domain-containing protein, partial [Humidesulfovibrio sp.]|nr:MASE1 domain-containing protein [Humidesulfovibrio sp.]